eukprot:2574862-Pyramimonas_sp.AAC.1
MVRGCSLGYVVSLLEGYRAQGRRASFLLPGQGGLLQEVVGGSARIFPGTPHSPRGLFRSTLKWSSAPGRKSTSAKANRWLVRLFHLPTTHSTRHHPPATANWLYPDRLRLPTPAPTL